MSSVYDTSDLEYDSPQSIRNLLDEYGLTIKKRFGQNFLINGHARARIIDALEIEEGDSVWEIGPGIGSLTHVLHRKGVPLTVFEIDRGFVRVLRDLFPESPKFRVIEGDFVHTWREYNVDPGKPNLVVGNLPYNSAAAIFLEFIGGGIGARKIVCTIQKESAARMTASPGMKDYGSFTVLCSLIWNVRAVFDLKPGSFYPAPRVQSTVIELTPSGRELKVPVGFLLDVTRGLFANRRKTIKNNLKLLAQQRTLDPGELYTAAGMAGVDIDARSETLSPDRVEELLVCIKKTNPSIAGGK